MPPLSESDLQQSGGTADMSKGILGRADIGEGALSALISLVVAVAWILCLHKVFPGDWSTILLSVVLTGAEAWVLAFTLLVHVPAFRWPIVFFSHFCSGSAVIVAGRKACGRYVTLQEQSTAGNKAIWDAVKIFLMGTTFYLGFHLMPLLREFNARHDAAAVETK